MDEGLRRYVLRRDGGCVARFLTMPLERMRWPMLIGLPDPGPCRNVFGDQISPYDLRLMQADHVKHPDEHAMGLKAVDDIAHLWTVCPGHHTEGQNGGRRWATMSVVREAAVLYIAAANTAALRYGSPPMPVHA